MVECAFKSAWVYWFILFSGLNARIWCKSIRLSFNSYH
jgi:hypothetical protein